jgi:hypothetical protein
VAQAVDVTRGRCGGTVDRDDVDEGNSRRDGSLQLLTSARMRRHRRKNGARPVECRIDGTAVEVRKRLAQLFFPRVCHL